MIKRTRFFSLIELLIAIAIIAILASMLLPALNKAREKGKEASCRGKLKQIGLATTLYNGDYQDQMPYCEPNVGSGDSGGSIYDASGFSNRDSTKENLFWARKVLKYMEAAPTRKPGQISEFYCTSVVLPLETNADTNMMTHGRLTYCYNGQLANCIEGSTETRKNAVAGRIRNPSSKVAYVETEKYSTRASLKPRRNTSRSSSWIGVIEGAGLVHGKQSNFGMCDGSIKSYSRDALIWSMFDITE